MNQIQNKYFVPWMLLFLLLSIAIQVVAGMSLDRCADLAVGLVATEARVRFSKDPKRALREDFNLVVSPVDHLVDARSDGGACDGLSFLQDGVVLYAPTPHSRRENFTLAHELGHHLVDSVPEIYDWLADQEDSGRLLETVCDRIAQRLLLDEGAAALVVGDGPLRARHVFDLYERAQASRPVCAIALSRYLRGLGAVAIIDKLDATVAFASVRPDPQFGWPKVFPWRGQQLGEVDPLVRLGSGESKSVRRAWRTPWGTQADFYVDAAADDKRTVAVFSDTDLWDVERFHAPIDRDFDTRPLLTGWCCGGVFEVRGYACNDCGRAFCPRCGDCRCGRDAKRAVTCSSCYLQFAPHLMVDGLCEDCR
ncbi:hypothetical protein HWD35_21450 [Tsukamurella tyrosinosolvens]|uniref:ImmA/IrrE family metallo-endopeptidase n=1 Tax=Tsukamurella tyrosinosolvens TaxID=57704 RepID=UPI001CE0676B|nr:hypothetical protein [Tsukamurella tyrosinosolvens]MCA4997293.1 hypothetical protein [Tsukamurella tyrosinosolvens]